MKYPQSVSRLNRALGIASGGLIFMVGILSVFEIIMRGVFNRPTAWSLDISQYILIWSIFLGTAYSLQEKGHVAVDFVRESIGKHTSRKVWFGITIVCYVFCIVVIGVFFWDGIMLSRKALALNKLTIAYLQIPMIYLTVAIVIGSILLLITVFCIILDLLGGSDYYL